MATYSPTYRAIAAQFQPLQHGHGCQLLSNPVLVGSAEPVAVLANVVAYHSLYWLTGPAFPTDEATQSQFLRTVMGGPAAADRFNEGRPESQQIHRRPTHAAALADVWALVSTHYGLTDAAEQVQHELLRRETRIHQEREEHWAHLERAGK